MKGSSKSTGLQLHTFHFPTFDFILPFLLPLHTSNFTLPHFRLPTSDFTLSPPCPAPSPPGCSSLLAVLFAVVNAANALNKGGDAAVFFEGGRRFLHAEPLYAGSSAADGFIGPPFQAMFFAPFAAVASASPVAAKLLWHALNLACLGLGVWLSMKTWDAVRGQIGLPARPWLPVLFAPLAAILLPLQTNFEHQNMNAAAARAPGRRDMALDRSAPPPSRDSSLEWRRRSRRSLHSRSSISRRGATGRQPLPRRHRHSYYRS